MERLQVQLEAAEAGGVHALAVRLQVPQAAAARLLVRAGLDALNRDPRLLLGAAWGGVSRTPADAPGSAA